MVIVIISISKNIFCSNPSLFSGTCPENVKITKCIHVCNNIQWKSEGGKYDSTHPVFYVVVYITMDKHTKSQLIWWFHQHITHLYAGNVN